MSIPWITLTPRLSKGIEYLNTIETSKFQLLIMHINKSLENNKEQPFSKDEIQKLEKSLNLNSEQLEVILSSLTEIIKLSKMFLMKPTVLQDDLTEKLNFTTEKAEIFLKFWTDEIKKDFEDIQDRKQLQNVAWELNLETASDTDLKKSVPTSLLQMELKDGNDKIELVTVEMNEDQLLKMYNDIEEIQNSLDFMNK